MSLSWSMAEDSYNYFSNINTENVIETNDFNQLSADLFTENNIQIGDLLYFIKNDDVKHAAIITGFDGDALLYSAHTNTKNEDPVTIDAYDTYTKITIVKLGDALTCD